MNRIEKRIQDDTGILVIDDASDTDHETLSILLDCDVHFILTDVIYSQSAHKIIMPFYAMIGNYYG